MEAPSGNVGGGFNWQKNFGHIYNNIQEAAAFFLPTQDEEEESETSRSGTVPGTSKDRIPFSLSSISLEISFEDIKKATNYFHESMRLGHGSYGTVYRAQMPDGTFVAVKLLDAPQEAGFEDEVKVLSRFRHPNLVILMGFARERMSTIGSSSSCLVYEYLEGGDCARRLMKSREGEIEFNARQRVSVLLDCAMGLSHLHNSKPRAFHRDIKTPNILLDKNGGAKMADFGLACVTNKGTEKKVEQISGTVGYACPYYIRSGVVTEHSETYSFGMVIFEMLTGRAPAYESEQPGQYVYLLDSINGSVENVMNMLDETACWPHKIARQLIDLAFACACRPPAERINFITILQFLRDIASKVETIDYRSDFDSEIKVGAKVNCQWKNTLLEFRGTISKVNLNGTCTITYDDNEVEHDVPFARIVVMEPAPPPPPPLPPPAPTVLFGAQAPSMLPGTLLPGDFLDPQGPACVGASASADPAASRLPPVNELEEDNMDITRLDSLDVRDRKEVIRLDVDGAPQAPAGDRDEGVGGTNNTHNNHARNMQQRDKRNVVNRNEEHKHNAAPASAAAGGGGGGGQISPTAAPPPKPPPPPREPKTMTTKCPPAASSNVDPRVLYARDNPPEEWRCRLLCAHPDPSLAIYIQNDVVIGRGHHPFKLWDEMFTPDEVKTVSRAHFEIQAQSSSGSSAFKVLCKGMNGMYLNRELIGMDISRELWHGDELALSAEGNGAKPFFKFIFELRAGVSEDDRNQGTINIPKGDIRASSGRWAIEPTDDRSRDDLDLFCLEVFGGSNSSTSGVRPGLDASQRQISFAQPQSMGISTTMASLRIGAYQERFWDRVLKKKWSTIIARSHFEIRSTRVSNPEINERERWFFTLKVIEPITFNRTLELGTGEEIRLNMGDVITFPRGLAEVHMTFIDLHYSPPPPQDMSTARTRISGLSGHLNNNTTSEKELKERDSTGKPITQTQTTPSTIEPSALEHSHASSASEEDRSPMEAFAELPKEGDPSHTGAFADFPIFQDPIQRTLPALDLVDDIAESADEVTPRADSGLVAAEALLPPVAITRGGDDDFMW